MATSTTKAPPVKPARAPESKPGVADATFPVRILHAVGMAFSQNTRYAMSSLLVRSREGRGPAKSDQIDVVATDGRRIIIVKHDTDLYSGKVDIVVPGDVARNALKVASKSGDDEPTATITQNRNAFTLKVSTTSGDSMFTWKTDGDALPFPAYEDVVPDFKMFGVSEIGVNPERMAKTLQVVTKIIGADHSAKMFLPGKSTDPLGLEATDGGTIEITAIVMPSPIGDWTHVEKEQADGEADDQHEMFEAWRGTDLADFKLGDGLLLKLKAGGLVTAGQLADHVAAGRDVAALEGVSRAQADKITDALKQFYKDRKITPPAGPATDAEKARDEAQEGLLAYLDERLKSVGVPAGMVGDNTRGQKMTNGVLMVVFKCKAKDVGDKIAGPGVTAASLKTTLDQLKDLADGEYVKAAKAAGVDVKAGGASAIKGGKGHVLPS